MDSVNVCQICFENKTTLKICPNIKCKYEMCGDCDAKNGNRCPFCRFDKSVIVLSPKCYICEKFEAMFIKNEDGNCVCMNCYNTYKPCSQCRKDINKVDLKNDLCNDCYENDIYDMLEKFTHLRQRFKEGVIFNLGYTFFYRRIMLCNDERINHIQDYLIDFNKLVKEFEENYEEKNNTLTQN